MHSPSKPKNEVDYSIPSRSAVLKTVAFDHAMAGIGAGATATLILHPLDLIKIRFQVSDPRVSGQPIYKGTLDAFYTIWKMEGWRGLYQGLSPNLVGAAISWGSYFYWYEMIKQRVFQKENLPKTKLSPLDHMAAAAIAGTLTTALTNPIWVIKTRMCADLAMVSADRKYRGLIHGLFQVATLEGFKGWYKGFLPSLLGVSHGTFQFMAYEELKSILYTYHNLQTHDKLSDVEYLFMGAISKTFATVITYPYQVVRARLQNQRNSQNLRYKGALDVIQQTWKYDGFKGYYRGLIPTVIRVTPASCIIFVVYERLLKLAHKINQSL